MKKIILSIVLFLSLLWITGCSSNKDYTNELEFGELLSKIENCTKTNDNGECEKNTLVIKAKLEKSLTNETTINNNYFNVEKYIQNNDISNIDELQYWAVADMTNGNESKFISFTVNKDLMEKIKDKKVSAINYGELVDDLWILPSLLN